VLEVVDRLRTRALAVGVQHNLGHPGLPGKIGRPSPQRQAMHGFKEAESFDVRYYKRWALRRLIEETIGAARMSTDYQFGLGWQMSCPTTS